MELCVHHGRRAAGSDFGMDALTELVPRRPELEANAEARDALVACPELEQQVAPNRNPKITRAAKR